MKFSQILQELREECKITQKELARQCGLSPQCISSLEKEQRYPTGSTLSVLADFFNVSTDYLLGRTDDFGSVIASPTAPALSSEENAILDMFRKMNRQQHVQLFAYCEGLLGASAPSIQTTK